MQFCHLSVSQYVILIGLTLFRSLVLSDNSWVIIRRYSVVRTLQRSGEDL